MGAESQFKHVQGPVRTFESICMNCLLAVGICSSEEELTAKESQHSCGERVDLRLVVNRRDTAPPIKTSVSRYGLRVSQAHA